MMPPFTPIFNNVSCIPNKSIKKITKTCEKTNIPLIPCLFSPTACSHYVSVLHLSRVCSVFSRASGGGGDRGARGSAGLARRGRGRHTRGPARRARGQARPRVDGQWLPHQTRQGRDVSERVRGHTDAGRVPPNGALLDLGID